MEKSVVNLIIGKKNIPDVTPKRVRGAGWSKRV